MAHPSQIEEFRTLAFRRDQLTGADSSPVQKRDTLLSTKEGMVLIDDALELMIPIIEKICRGKRCVDSTMAEELFANCVSGTFSQNGVNKIGAVYWFCYYKPEIPIQALLETTINSHYLDLLRSKYARHNLDKRYRGFCDELNSEQTHNGVAFTSKTKTLSKDQVSECYNLVLDRIPQITQERNIQRDQTIFKLLSEECSQREIAARLQIPLGTVKTAIECLFKRLRNDEMVRAVVGDISDAVNINRGP